MVQKLSLIVAMAENRCIGADNNLLWHIPEDLKRFKTVTMGAPVIMGRKTYESILDQLGKPLPGRQNIVVSRSGYKHEGCESSDSLDKAIAAAQGDEIFIIGGAQIYEQSLPQADRLYLTIVHKDYEGDAFFPVINWDDWNVEEDGEGEKDNLPYSFFTMSRKASG